MNNQQIGPLAVSRTLPQKSFQKSAAQPSYVTGFTKVGSGLYLALWALFYQFASFLRFDIHGHRSL
jgi:hypothetical protein